jgi:hypothetical protein
MTVDLELEHIHREVPMTLFHYTSHEAALGIMTSGTLWATHLGYLNDEEELHHALRLFRRQITASRRSSTERVSYLLEQMLDALDGVAESNIGVFSLSEEPDLLSQWRAYCPRGVGYALGFDSASLIAAVAPKRVQLGACVYDRELQEIVVSQAISDTVTSFQTALDAANGDYDLVVEQHRIQFMARAARVAAYIKHEAFAEEREWRLVALLAGVSQAPWRFRSGRVSMIPYLSLPAAEKDADVRLNRVVVGPSPDGSSAFRSGRLFFEAHGLHPQSVKRSRIPFRSWG